jgi:hypothetical protein
LLEWVEVPKDRKVISNYFQNLSVPAEQGLQCLFGKLEPMYVAKTQIIYDFGLEQLLECR